MSAALLFAEVIDSYDENGLITLTNIRDRTATAIDTAVGEKAAQGVINVWPAYAQEEFDILNPLHVDVATFGVIAYLWRRGGSSTTIEQVKWDEVFVGLDSMIVRVLRTNARARIKPSTTGPDLAPDGTRIPPWSDFRNYQYNMPRRPGRDRFFVDRP